jgi:Pyruvate/2-oxoacid:ferredoxin oxidoreductase gamma subunit
MANGITNFFGGTTGIDYAEIKTFAESGIDEYETQIITNAKVLGAFSKAMSDNASASAEVEWKNIGVNILGAIGSIFGGDSKEAIPYDQITAFAAVPWGEETTKKIQTNALTLHAYTTAIAKMSSLKQEDGFWSSIGKSLSGAFSALLGQDKMPIEEITAFTETELDLKVVENNISAIEKFMEFGTSLNDWVPGDTGKFGDFAAGLVTVSNGIYTALHGGEYSKPGWNMTIDEGKGLASVDIMDVQNSAKGIAVLRHSLIAQEPLKALQAASASMDASTGDTTIVNANNNSTNNSSSSTNNYREMDIDHNEQSGSWYSRIDWTPWN